MHGADPTHLRHHHNLVAREVVLLDGLAEDDLRETVAVNLGCAR